jgi:pilus assembly protein Flp/PilA
MRDLKQAFIRLASDDSEGQGMVEYGLIIAFVALVVIAALVIFGPQMATMYNRISASVPT